MSNSFDSDKHQQQSEITKPYEERIKVLEKAIIEGGEELENIKQSLIMSSGIRKAIFKNWTKSPSFKFQNETIDLEDISSISDLSAHISTPKLVEFYIRYKSIENRVRYTIKLVDENTKEKVITERNELVKAWERYKYN